jgi:p-hydroxybenzoate 3-monooxygenase
MTKVTRTQVAVIGAGPAGLLLSELLRNAGIDSIVIDRQSRSHIEARIRAGVLEWGTVEALREAGVGARMDTEGMPHSGFEMCFDGQRHRIDLAGLADRKVMVYGQTELTKDLIASRLSSGAPIIFEASNVQIDEVTSQKPQVSFELNGLTTRIECDYVAGCDGFHGVARQTIPAAILKTYERVCPFGWLGVLLDKPPVSDELIYGNGPRGFALCSMRSKTRSRYYLQCNMDEKLENWSDTRFFDELEKRLAPDIAQHLQRGVTIEKSIAPLRSFVAEPMRYGALFLAGDAAHIVPPTGAKGLNLAVADVRVLARALTEYYQANSAVYLDRYSEICLKRVWKVERFSWYMSQLLHQFPEASPFEQKMQQAEFDYLTQSESACQSIAENYVGLPLEI